MKFNNGAEAVINIASFQESMQLKNTISKALLAQKVEVAKIDLKNLDSLFSAILAIDSDLEVQNALFKCLARCTYNSQKITQDTFENAEARENYYQLAIECLKVNLEPFIKPLISQFKTRLENTLNQEPKSQQAK